MDILTQAVLGAAVAVATTKAISVRKAVIIGAILAILPDLDLLIPYDNSVELLIHHRTWSHSWIVHALIAPIFAYFFSRIESAWSFKTSCLLTFLVLTTHSGLDALTVFGTDIFWPLSSSTIVGGSVFIIDPIYTTPLLLFFVHALWKPQYVHIWRNSLIVLFISSTYLSWGVVAQTLVKENAISNLNNLGINTENILVTATPFNTLLWRVLVIDGDSYYEGFRSILDSNEIISFKKSTRLNGLLYSLEKNDAFKKLTIFNHGYYSISKQSNTSPANIIVTDLRKSFEDTHTFRFLLGSIKGSNVSEVKPSMLDRPVLPDGFYYRIWHRIFNEI